MAPPLSTIRISIGLAIVAVGILMFGQQFHWWFISFDRWWPLFVLLPGLALFARAQQGKTGVFIPATVLTILGLYFFFEVWTDWSTADVTAFIYPLSVALGFFLVAEKVQSGRGGLRFVMWILLFSSAVTLVAGLGQTKYWPIVLIILGVAVMFGPKWFKNKASPTSSTTIP